MIQEILALVIIFFFLWRLGVQLHHHQIPKSQFLFWLIFWLIAGLVVIYLQELDRLVARLGFSSSGIEVLLYLAVAIILYVLVRMRLKMEQMEKNITTLTRLLSRHSNPSSGGTDSRVSRDQ